MKRNKRAYKLKKITDYENQKIYKCIVKKQNFNTMHFFYVEFSGIACFYQVFCLQPAVPYCGQGIG